MQKYYSKKSKSIQKVLRRVSKCKYTLLSLEERYNRLYCESLAKGQKITGMPFCTKGYTDKVGERNVELASLEEMIIDARCNLISALREAKRIIDKIDDDTIRTILDMKYIRGKDEIQVANEVRLSMKAVDKILDVFFMTDVNLI